MLNLSHHFLTKDRARHLEQARQAKWFIKAKTDKEKRDDVAEQSQDALLAMGMDAIAATEARLHAFEVKLNQYETQLYHYDARLDIYDEAVTRALMEQLERLDILNTQKETMLETAFVLEDGRKVFKSKDGTYAVLESGTLLSEADFAQHDIAPGPHTAEAYLGVVEGIEATQNEIDLLHEAQAKIDTARDRMRIARDKIDDGNALLDKDGVTELELDEFEQEFEAIMPVGMPSLPTSAMKFLSDSETSAAPAASTAFMRAAVEKRFVVEPIQTLSKPLPELGG